MHEYRSQIVQVYMSECVKEFKCGNVQVYRGANVRSAGEHKFKCVVVQVYRTASVQELWPLLRFSIYHRGALQEVRGGAGIGLHIV